MPGVGPILTVSHLPMAEQAVACVREAAQAGSIPSVGGGETADGGCITPVRFLSVPMTVMNFRHMRVVMDERGVSMRMRVRHSG